MVINSFVVFALTLILTKSKILGEKREFVELRYEAAKIEGTPSFTHTWFYKMWTCPMCSGFWIAILISMFYPVNGLVPDVLVVFGINWLLHCLENILFFGGEVMKNVDSIDSEKIVNSMQKIETYYERLERELWKKK